MTAALLALGLALPAAADAAVAADGGDTRAAAEAVESLPAGTSMLVDRPGDQDWFSIAGRNADDSTNLVFVRVLRSAPGCDALTVGLFNPEGRWMRTSTATTGEVASMRVPDLVSRYALDVRATDAACAGLEYEVTHVSTEVPPPDSAASRCLVARNKRAEAARRLRSLQRRRDRVIAAARPRYDAYVAQAKRALAAARRTEARRCARPA